MDHNHRQTQINTVSKMCMLQQVQAQLESCSDILQSFLTQNYDAQLWKKLPQSPGLGCTVALDTILNTK